MYSNIIVKVETKTDPHPFGQMSETEKKIFSIKEIHKVLEWLPGVTIVLVVVGYINHHIYYAKFGIPIYNFISVSEILLLFVPFVFNYIQNFLSIVFIIIFLFLLMFYLIKLPYLIEGESKSNIVSDDAKVENEKKLVKEIKQDILSFDIGYNINQIISLFKGIIKAPIVFISIEIYIKNLFDIFIRLSILYFIGCVVYMGFAVLQPNLFRKDDTKIEAGLILILLCIVISAFELFTHNFFKYVLGVKKEDMFYNYWFFCKIFIYIGLFFYLCITAQYENIIHSQTDFEVSFSYNNKKEIRTNDKLVYIGATQKYIFLKDLISNDNNIFKIDSIGNMTIKKVDYTYEYFPFFKDFNKK